MGPLKQFCINYVNNQQVLYPGQVLAGQVVLEITEPVKARGVYLTLCGESYVYWTEQRNNGNQSYTETFSDRERYLNHRITLWGKADGERNGDNHDLPPGIHTFPFSVQLPVGLPSSFEGRGPFVAFIRYWVAANVNRPWKFDFKSKRPFTIIEYIDINNPSFLTPMRSENDKHLCCLCCKSGPLSIQASIDRTGYCPGELVVVSASAENLTNREMGGMRAQLISITSVRARGQLRSSKKVLSEMMGEKLAVGARDAWESRPLLIPPASPSIKSCRIIDHSYFVQVCVVVPRGINLKIHFPVVLGTIPLRVTAPPPMGEIAFVDNKTLGNHGLPQAIAMPQEAPTIPSVFPSYAEAAGGESVNIADADDKETYGILQYVPVYPFAASGAAPMEQYQQSDQQAYPQQSQMPYPAQIQLPYPQPYQLPYSSTTIHQGKSGSIPTLFFRRALPWAS